MLSYERTSTTAMVKMILFEELIYVLDLIINILSGDKVKYSFFVQISLFISRIGRENG
jgi:hypothetical protein